MTKELPTHKDKLGRELKVGDFVVAPFGTRDLRICSVEKINPKMIKVKPARTETQYRSWAGGTTDKYPEDLLIINDKDVTRYFMTK